MIEVRNLRKEYGKIVAVDGISFSVKAGSIFAFLGPNGAGKSTTIKMLTTLLRPTSGEVFLDDELTARENMDFHGVLYGLPTALRHKRVEELMKFVELWDRRDDLVKTFSGGMKRRLEIARGFLHHPKIIFLDEPTLGLDPQTRNHIWEYVRGLNRDEGITVFFTTHYMEEAEKMAHEIAVIDRGKIVASGTVEGLKAKTGTPSLEEAFLAVTGRNIREEAADGADRMRMHNRAWGRR
jgi:ABC-2 type transport system ATP-binding protein